MAESGRQTNTICFEHQFYSILGQKELLQADVSIPFEGDVLELAQHIIMGHHADDPLVKCGDILTGK